MGWASGAVSLPRFLSLSQRSLLFRNEQFSSASKNFLFHAFVGRFRKLAVILGFNVCVLSWVWMGLQEQFFLTVCIELSEIIWSNARSCVTESNLEV